ncbi:MAG TPA: peptidoglycan DD-metalloendopeptidase family protein, partial [Elusimicrobiota bacterium]|nr:peptidoglycan DD-metalloendopeptidase family protein [Elusimicrobiota bacterium]
ASIVVAPAAESESTGQLAIAGRVQFDEDRIARVVAPVAGQIVGLRVKVGDRVARGQMIAYMGTTGRSTGHHLHYEVWRHGRPTNPMRFLRVEAGAE